MNEFEIFSQLHYSEKPLLVGNAWDVESAKLLEEAGFKAIATSSAAIAGSMGYEDGQQMPFGLLFDIVKRIRKAVAIPLSVDMERGYANTLSGVVINMEKLCDLGVAGVNIEDSTSEGRLKTMESFQKTIAGITNHLARKNRQLFINARTDSFLLKQPDARAETIRRAVAYEAAGANGLFVPFMKMIPDIKAVTGAVSIPVSVFFCEGLPGLDALAEAGIKRISMGAALYNAMKIDLRKRIEVFRTAGQGELGIWD